MILINRAIYILLILFFLGLPEDSLCQTEFPDLNLSLRYQPDSNIPIEYQVCRTDSSFVVFFSVETPEKLDLSQDFRLSYEVKKSYSDNKSLIVRTLNEHLHGIGKLENLSFFRFEIPEMENYNVLLIKLENTISGISFYQDIPLNTVFINTPPDFYLENNSYNLPVCTSFITLQDSLMIRNLDPENSSFYVYRYDHEFDPADPPMYRIDKEVRKSLKVDTTFSIGADEPFFLSEEGLYFIQSDTNSAEGIGIRMEELLYPKLVRMEDLINPVIYLTTRQEINKLNRAEDQRREFEKFWLNISRSEDQARWIIKKYFEKVEQANSFFTNYKPGWKTDMGMIYIIFGPPDQVFSTGENESWYYRNEVYSQTVVFNFLRLKNLFSDNHYMLIRDKEYKNVWFRSIDEWRKGRK